MAGATQATRGPGENAAGLSAQRYAGLRLIAASGALLALATWVYAPGLSGGFLFDDYANLPVIGATGVADDWAPFWRYVTSGSADPTGRPLALLSFLIDGRDWPTDPRPFLRTNLALHLLNGALLFLLLRRLGVALAPRQARRATWAAWLATALWLLHPLLVSTTLYIVQREAMLPATFVLLGLLAWLHGRGCLHAGRSASGLAWMAVGLGLCTALAFASKANGALLPALALVLEWTVLRGEHEPHEPGRRLYRGAMALLAGLPALLLAGYLLYRGYAGFTHGVAAHRPWTLGERLLTEARILFQYLDLLWLPRPFTPGLFNDATAVSTSLIAPWTTLPAVAGVLTLIALACRWHRRWPAIAAACLFYFVGQAMESTTIALELYYEHRNYLPALILFWPLALWLCGVPQQRGELANDGITAPAMASRRAAPWLKAGLIVLLIGGFAIMTHARAALWGNQTEQALLWATLNPESPRAQAYAAQAEVQAGRPLNAVARLRPLLAQHPDEVQLALNLFAAECAAGAVSPDTLAASTHALEATRNPGGLLVSWFDRRIDRASDPQCPQANLGTLRQLLDAAQRNPQLQASAGRRQDIRFLLGQLALARGAGNQALGDFNRALAASIRPDAALKQAAALGAQGFPREGLAHLACYRQLAQERPYRPGYGMPRVHAWVLEKQRYWQHEVEVLTKTLEADAIATRTASIPAATCALSR